MPPARVHVARPVQSVTRPGGKQARGCCRKAEGDSEGNSLRKAWKKETRKTKPAAPGWLSSDAQDWLCQLAKTSLVAREGPAGSAAFRDSLPSQVLSADPVHASIRTLSLYRSRSRS